MKTYSKKVPLLIVGCIFLTALLLLICIHPSAEDDTLLFGYAKAILFSAIIVELIAFYYLFTKETIRYEWIFAGLLLGFGLIYLFAITPLSSPDEAHHYQTAYTLSNLLMGKEVALGNAADFDYTGFVNHYNVSSGYLRIIQDFFSPGIIDENIIVPGSRSLVYVIEYLPQAIFITIGRLFHLNFLHLCQLGRLANLLFSTVCLFFAIKWTPKFKMLMGMIFLLPMSIHQAVSLSYDAYVNAMTILTMSCLLHAIFGEGKLTVKDIVRLTVIALLQAPAKTVYALIILLAFCIPKERFSKPWKKYVYVSLLVLACCIFSYKMLRTPPISNRAGDRSYYEGGTMYSVGWILSHIPEALIILLKTIWHKWYLWILQCIGASLSGLTLNIPTLLIVPFGVLTLVSTQCECHGDVTIHHSFGKRLAFFGSACLIALLICLDMFVAFTYNTRPMIDGVQGRYFLPLVLPAFVAIYLPKIKIKEKFNRFLIMGSAGLQFAIILRILSYTLENS